MRRATNSEVVLMTSASRKTTSSDVVAAEPGPHGLALAARAVEANDARAVMVRDRRGVVDGVVVDHDQFVDQFAMGEHGVEDRADRGRLVARRDDDRDGGRRTSA